MSFFLKPEPKNIRLIDFPIRRPKDTTFSLGMASILAQLQFYGVVSEALAFPVTNDIDIDGILNKILKDSSESDYLGLGVYVWNDHIVKDLLEKLEAAHYPGKIILGGPQIQANLTSLELKYPFVDIFISGYAEEALVQLLVSKEQKPCIPGINYRGQRFKTLARLNEPQNLVSPLLSGVIQPNENKYLRWETKRGCPFSCSYCKHNGGEVSKVIEFSKSRIEQEISWMMENDIRDIAVVDPTFNLGSTYLFVLDQLAQAQYSGKISFQTRANLCRSKFLKKLDQLSETADITLEFGLQTIHRKERELINRLDDLKRTERILREIRDFHDVNLELSIIYGLPQQTLDSFKETVDFCERLGIPTNAYPLMLLPGTPLYDNKEKLGLKEAKGLIAQGCEPHLPYVISSPSFDITDWEKMNKLATSLNDSVYKAHSIFNL